MTAMIQDNSQHRLLVGDYIISSTIGHGSSGRVKLGIHQITGEKVAIKIISRSQLNSSIKITQAVERELAVLQLLHHPNLIDLHQVLQDEKNVYFITEYVPGGELYHVLNKGRLSEEEARHIFGQIASALAWCHSRHICHRDLKPENILLDKNRKNIKIADFGMATMQSMNSLLKTSCGSPHYASPEIIRGIPYYGPSTDTWSAGIILYTLLTGKLPFDDHHVGRLLAKIKTGRFKKIPNWVSPSAKDLIYRILIVDPTQRISINDILSHPWMVPYNIANNNNNNSIHSFSLQCNPWHDDELKQPLILNSAGLYGPIKETLKVLWRNLTNDQIISALMDKKPNLPKLTYQLLLQRQNRQLDNFVERSTDSIEKNLICNTDKKSSFYSNNSSLNEPCESILLNNHNNDNTLLSLPSPSDKDCHLYSSTIVFNPQQIEPNRRPKVLISTSKNSSLTLLTQDHITTIYPSSEHSSFISHLSQQKNTHLKITSNHPTTHETILSSNKYIPATTTTSSIEKTLKSLLKGDTKFLFQNDNSIAQVVHATINTSNRVKTFMKNTCKLISTTFNHLKNNNNKQQHYQKITRQEFTIKCIAKSEFVAAGKLHYILSNHFEGKLNGCMYPDGKILWSGEIDKTTLNYNNKHDDSNKTCFLCKIRIVSDTKSLYRLVFIIHREDTDLVTTFANELFNLLVLYEKESNLVLDANHWK